MRSGVVFGVLTVRFAYVSMCVYLQQLHYCLTILMQAHTYQHVDNYVHFVTGSLPGRCDIHRHLHSWMFLAIKE